MVVKVLNQTTDFNIVRILRRKSSSDVALTRNSLENDDKAAKHKRLWNVMPPRKYLKFPTKTFSGTIQTDGSTVTILYDEVKGAVAAAAANKPAAIHGGQSRRP